MSGLLDGVLTHDLLEEISGRPLTSMPGFIHSDSTGGSRDKHLVFLVDGGASRPFALVKWARGDRTTSLLREHAAIEQIRLAGDAALASSCPPSWGPYSAGPDSVITIQRTLDGRPAYAQLRTSLWPRRCTADHFRRAEAWLARFTASTRQSPAVLTSAMLEVEVEVPLLEYCRSLDPTPNTLAAAERTMSSARAWLGRTVAPVAEHGDLWVANVLVPPGEKGAYVVDWEHYRPVALPGFDMLTFCTTYGLELPWRPYGWAKPTAAILRTYVHRTWLAEHVRRFLVRGCRASGLAPASVPVLLSVALARMALRSAEEDREGEAGSWVEALRAWWQRPRGGWLDEWAGT